MPGFNTNEPIIPFKHSMRNWLLYGPLIVLNASWPRVTHRAGCQDGISFDELWKDEQHPPKGEKAP